MAIKGEAGSKKRLVVGMSGASGAIMGIELLKALRKKPEWETHLVITKGAMQTIRQETQYETGDVAALADKFYRIDDIGASIASGTFKTEGMVIIPCSMKTVAGIASGYSDNLLLRAADVTIKEGRKLILAARECPLSVIHLRNMLALAELGAVIMPPMITFYNEPVGVDNLITHINCKILDRLGIEPDGFKRWGGEAI